MISILGAVTEGFGISLFVPLLDFGIGRLEFLRQFLCWRNFQRPLQRFPAEIRIKLVAAIMLLVVLVRGGLQQPDQGSNLYLPVRIEHRLRTISFDCLLNMSLAAVHATRSGGVQVFVSNHPTRISQVMLYLGSLIFNLVMLTIYAALMMLISVKFTLLSLLFIAAVFYLQRHISSGELRCAGDAVTLASGKLGQVVHETLGGLNMIRLCAAGPVMFSHYREGLKFLRSAQTRYAHVSSLITPLFITASGTLICVLLFAASATGLNDRDTVAMVLLFLFLLQRLLGPTASIATARNGILFNMDAMFEFQAWVERACAEFQKDGDLPFKELKRGIRFERVTFSYDAKSGNVLKNLSFSIPKDKMIAIVGPSGAGKSTVVSLLGRLYDPQAGAVLVDDVDMREYKADSWRRS